MMTIITACLPLFLKLIGMAMDSDKFSKEQKESFQSFVLTMQASQTASAQLNQSYDAQVEELKKKIQSENQGEIK